MPDPVDLGKTKSVVDPVKRIAVQGRVVKPKAARPTPSK
jgi:hypothetical protein